MFFSQIWSFCLLGVFLAMPRLAERIKISRASTAWLIVLAVALAARLLPAMALPTGSTYDVESYSIVGGLVLNGRDVYTSAEAESRYPYLPLQMYWSALSHKLVEVNQISYHKVVKIEPVLADVAIALVLFASLLRASSLKTAFAGGLLYAVNPIPVFVAAYHGQFDAMAILPVLLSLYSLGAHNWLSGIWLGVGILVKSWPVLALPSLLTGIKTWNQRFVFLTLAGLVPVLAILFYVVGFESDVTRVLSRAISYNRGIGVWGYTYLFRLIAYFVPASTDFYTWITTLGRFFTLAGLGFAWFWRARKETPQDGILTILVTFFAITHAFAIQYMMWLIPFAILSGDLKWLRRYTIAAFLYMFIAYFTLVLQVTVTNFLPWPQADLFIIIPAGLPAWIVCLAWAYQRIFRPASQPISTVSEAKQSPLQESRL